MNQALHEQFALYSALRDDRSATAWMNIWEAVMRLNNQVPPMPTRAIIPEPGQAAGSDGRQQVAPRDPREQMAEQGDNQKGKGKGRGRGTVGYPPWEGADHRGRRRVYADEGEDWTVIDPIDT